MSVHLCFSVTDECCCCGGSASLGGTQDPVPGSRPSLQYCSVECHDDWEDFLATQALREQR